MEAILAYCTKCGVRERVHVDLSGSVDAPWLGGPIHMIFFDGGKTYARVQEDIEKWTPFVPQDGIVLFHDYTLYNTVRSAVDDLMQWGWKSIPGGGSIRAFRRLALGG